MALFRAVRNAVLDEILNVFKLHECGDGTWDGMVKEDEAGEFVLCALFY